jgi:hypothetical protein
MVRVGFLWVNLRPHSSKVKIMLEGDTVSSASGICFGEITFTNSGRTIKKNCDPVVIHHFGPYKLLEQHLIAFTASLFM